MAAIDLGASRNLRPDQQKAKKIKMYGLSFIFTAVVCCLGVFLFQAKDTSHIGKSNTTLKLHKQVRDKGQNSDYSAVVSTSETFQVSSAETGRVKATKLKYQATQVILPGDKRNLGPAVPVGTNLIGSLLSHVDTRSSGKTIRILLPYGAGDKWASIIPENTVLLSKASYPGQGERVYVEVFSAIFPDGSEHSISAAAVDSSDYAPGIIGETIGNTDTRVASGLALTMISAGTEVLTEKEALGDSSEVTPKSTMKNAALQGVGKIADIEANRRLSHLATNPHYLKISTGQDVIISLTGAFRVR